MDPRRLLDAGGFSFLALAELLAAALEETLRPVSDRRDVEEAAFLTFLT
jgi:hypothetical protein